MKIVNKSSCAVAVFLEDVKSAKHNLQIDAGGEESVDVAGGEVYVEVSRFGRRRSASQSFAPSPTDDSSTSAVAQSTDTLEIVNGAYGPALRRMVGTSNGEEFLQETRFSASTIQAQSQCSPWPSRHGMTVWQTNAAVPITPICCVVGGDWMWLLFVPCTYKSLHSYWMLLCLQSGVRLLFVIARTLVLNAGCLRIRYVHHDCPSRNNFNCAILHIGNNLLFMICRLLSVNCNWPLYTEYHRIFSFQLVNVQYTRTFFFQQQMHGLNCYYYGNTWELNETVTCNLTEYRVVKTTDSE